MQQMERMQQRALMLQQGEFQLKTREQNRKDADTATDNLREEEKFQHERYMDFIEAGIEIQQKRAVAL